MASRAQLFAVFAAGAAVAWLVPRRAEPPRERPAASVPAPIAPPQAAPRVAVGAADVRAPAPVAAHRPGIPPAQAEHVPAPPNPRIGQRRALARALDELTRDPAGSPSAGLDPETTARVADGVRAHLLALQGENP